MRTSRRPSVAQDQKAHAHAHILQKNPGLIGYYAAPLITIARETYFTLRTLEHVAFATGWSPTYPRATTALQKSPRAFR